jgi:hypothetical protein
MFFKKKNDKLNAVPAIRPIDLRKSIRELVVEEVANIDIGALFLYSDEKRRTINSLYRAEVIDDETIYEGLRKAIVKRARDDYQFMQDIKKGGYRRVYADHDCDCRCLAYALENDVFNAEELKNMHFDHGENPQKYVRLYGRKDILNELKEEILNPRSNLVSSSDDLEHFVCNW